MRQQHTLSPKIQGLRDLMSCGLDVPQFAIVPAAQDLDLDDSVLTEPDRQVFARIRNALALAAEDAEICLQQGVSIRSASEDEDTEDHSNAGRYLSFNAITDLEHASAAALHIWMHHRQRTPGHIKCPLILQQYHRAYFSGVAFAFLSRECFRLEIESYYGGCRSVVEGRCIPYRSSYEDDRGWHHKNGDGYECTRFTAHRELIDTIPSDVCPGMELVPVCYPFPGPLRLFAVPYTDELDLYGYRPQHPPHWFPATTCAELARATRAICVSTSMPGIDLEWGCGVDGAIRYYQCRRATAEVGHCGQTSFADVAQHGTNVLFGLPAAGGVACGIVRDPSDCITSPAEEPTICMLGEATVNDIAAIKNSVAVVAARGGMLSHLATACRELMKPCVTGIGLMLRNGDKVEVDGSAGVVRRVEMVCPVSPTYGQQSPSTCPEAREDAPSE